MPADRSERRNAIAPATGRPSDVSHPSGARSAQLPAMRSNPGIPLPAIVFIGPADTVLTRIFFGPRSRAR